MEILGFCLFLRNSETPRSDSNIRHLNLRDRDAEGRALAELRLERELPAHRLGELAADGQAEPGAAVARDLRRDLGVGHVDLVLVLLADARAGVLDLDDERPHVAVGVDAVEARAHFDKPPLGELDGVRDEVEDDVPEAQRVHHQGRHVVRRVADVDLRLGRPDPERLLDLVEERVAVGRRERQLRVAGVAPREVEDVVHEREERLAARQDRVHRLGLLLPGVGAVLEHLGEADDGVERGADVVADRGEEEALRLRGLLLAPGDDGVDAVHHHERDEQQRDLDEVVVRERLVHPCLLPREEFGVIGLLGGDCAVVVDRHVALVELGDDLVGEVALHLPVPHVAGEEDEEEEDDPRHRRLAEPAGAVAPEHHAEDDDAEDAPHGEDQVRLRRERVHHPEVGDEEVDEERKRHHEPGGAARYYERTPLPAGDGERAPRDVGVGDARADRRDVDDPAHHRAPDERQQARDGEDQEDGVPRAAVPVELGERLPEEPVAGHRVDEAARGDDLPDEPGHDRGDGGDREDEDAGLAEGRLDGVEDREPPHVLEGLERGHVSAPVGEALGADRRRREHGEHVDGGRGEEREHDHHGRPLAREAELLGGVGDRLEADERPWRERNDGEHLERGAPAVRERGGERGKPAFVAREHHRHRDGDSSHEDESEEGLDARGEALAADEHGGGGEKRRHRKEDLAEVDVEAEHLVAEAEAEDAAEEVALDERERGDVGPGDRGVGEDEKPAADVAVVGPADVPDVAVGAAGLGEVLHEVVVVAPHEDHDERADDEADERAERPRDRKERRPRHDESAPADGAAKGQRPCLDGRKILAQCAAARCFIIFH